MFKWHGRRSKTEAVPGRGPQGVYLRNLKCIAKYNQSADCVEKNNMVKFVDDLTTLE